MTGLQTTNIRVPVRAMNLLATLNTLRAAAGKPPLKAWKESRAKLEKAITKAHGEVPIGSKAVPDVPVEKVIASLDAANNMVRVSQAARADSWKDQPLKQSTSSITLKSIAISKTPTEGQKKIEAANKAQGKKKSTSERARYDWEAAEAKAKTGVLPTPPDMSAPTHKHYVGKLAEVATLARTGKLDELRKYKVGDRNDGSPGLVKRYQAIAIIALKAKS